LSQRLPILLALGGMHAFMLAVLLVWLGGVLGLMGFAALVSAELAIWQTRSVRSPRLRAAEVIFPDYHTRPATPPPPIQQQSLEAKMSDDPVEIARRPTAARRSQPIPPPPPEIGAHVTVDRPLQCNIPASEIYFFGPNTSLDLGRGRVHSPLVYATAELLPGTPDASLIEARLPVSPPGTAPQEELPYWPSYRQASPSQRSYYLDWLLGGRRCPETPLGYVFIYFYGLERRVLSDHQDHEPALTELLRLMSIYTKSNSFRSYASSFLWRAIFDAASLGHVSPTLVSTAIRATQRWHDDTLAFALAAFYLLAQPLSAEIAMAITVPRAPSSVVVKRNPEMFRRLFDAKYQARFGAGLTLRAAKNHRNIDYHPASATLVGRSDRQQFLVTKVPNVAGLSSQFEPLLEIWSACIDDLRAYDRAQRSVNGKGTTSAMYEALPETVRSEDHPEFDAWLALWRKYDTPDGPPLLPIGELAAIKELPIAKSLTRKQSLAICSSADAMGFGIEPDCRLTGTSYEWDTRVALFILDEPPSEMGSYFAAAMLLELGMAVAGADGNVDELELKYIEQHLERRFELTVDQAKRLGCLRHILKHAEKHELRLAKRAAQVLSIDQRLVIGDFLVGIAATDQVVTAAETAALRRAYHALDLDISQLDRLLVPQNSDSHPSRESAPASFTLDLAVIATKMRETAEVAAILEKAMAVPEDELQAVRSPFRSAIDLAHPTTTRSPAADSQTTVATPSEEFEGLAAQYCPFLRLALQKPTWLKTELESVARDQQLMLSGTVEAINEWSQERFGDWLIEEGPEYRIHGTLISQGATQKTS
jgi:uncharacterized tellurite resistance protein B-like protein